MTRKVIWQAVHYCERDSSALVVANGVKQSQEIATPAFGSLAMTKKETDKSVNGLLVNGESSKNKEPKYNFVFTIRYPLYAKR